MILNTNRATRFAHQEFIRFGTIPSTKVSTMKLRPSKAASFRRVVDVHSSTVQAGKAYQASLAIVLATKGRFRRHLNVVRRSVPSTLGGISHTTADPSCVAPHLDSVWLPATTTNMALNLESGPRSCCHPYEYPRITVWPDSVNAAITIATSLKS